MILNLLRVKSTVHVDVQCLLSLLRVVDLYNILFLHGLVFLTTVTGPKPTRRIHAETECPRTKCIDVFIHIIVITEEVITLCISTMDLCNRPIDCIMATQTRLKILNKVRCT